MSKHTHNPNEYNQFHSIAGALQAHPYNSHHGTTMQSDKLAQIQKAQEKKKFHVIHGNLPQHDHTTFYLCFILILFVVLVILLQFFI